jgi:hypothetical protein
VRQVVLKTGVEQMSVRVVLAALVMVGSVAPGGVLAQKKPGSLGGEVETLQKSDSPIVGRRGATGERMIYVPLSGYGLYRQAIRLYDGTSLDDTAAAHLEAYERMLPSLQQGTRSRLLSTRIRSMYDLADFYAGAGRMDECVGTIEELLRTLEPLSLPESTRGFFLATAGVAWMRKGELENCTYNHNQESCILPLSAPAQHVRRDGFEKAKTYFLRYLELDPEHLQIRWLYNIVAMGLGEYPDRVPPRLLVPLPRPVHDVEVRAFTDVGMALGVSPWDQAGGAIMDDFTGDGLLDIVSTSWDPNTNMHLYVSNGDGTFRDVTEPAGLVGQRGGLNAVQGDYDNDGDLDILVLRGAWQEPQRNSLLRNNGDTTFTDVTAEAGLLLPARPGQVGAWGDYDNDGDLDLFVGNETRGAEALRPHYCQLFRNNGDGTFTDVAEAAGVRLPSYCKGASWGDYDNDGLLDLYLSNLAQPNNLFHNRGDGTFEDVTTKAGVAEPLSSFPCWFFDFDNDGWLDLFVASYEDPSDTYRSYLGMKTVGERMILYKNRGDGTFEDVTQRLGLTTVCMTMGANFGDLNTDGYLDILLGTGAPPFGDLVPNAAFLNTEGRQFNDVTVPTRLGHLQKGHGIAFGDIDNDGDEDIYAQLGGAIPGDAFANALYQNPGHGNHWITIRLRGTRSNRFGVGSRITLTLVDSTGSKSQRCRQVNWGGSFGSSSLQQEIGLGKATKIESVEVFWPASDTRQTLRDVPIDRIIEVTEGRDGWKEVSLPKLTLHGTDGGQEHHHHP